MNHTEDVVPNDTARGQTTTTTLHVDYHNASWRYVGWSILFWGFSPVLVPFLILLSRLRRKPISFGVVVEAALEEGE